MPVRIPPGSSRKPLSIPNIHISQLYTNDPLHGAGCKDAADLCLGGVHIHALFPAASSHPLAAVPSPTVTRAKEQGANREGRRMEEEEEEGEEKQHSR